MKNIIIWALSLMIVSGASAQFKSASFQASGLTCSMCSNAINKAVKSLDFVETIKTDLNTNTFTVNFKPGVAVDPDAIVKKVLDAGFSVAQFWLIASWNHQVVASDVHAQLGGLNFHFMNTPPRTLDGDIRLQIIDKDYVNAKLFKKNAVYTTMPCYTTGRMAPCCSKGAGAEGRIYHVTI